MYVHPIRPELDLKLVPVELREAEPRVAVLLNANAKRVDEKVRRSLSHVVPEGDLFLTRTFEEARAVAELVVDRRYQVVFTGGGDGTFVGFLNEIFNVIERRRGANPFAGPRPPKFGILKLGTGNALASLCAASPGDGILDDVLRARAAEVPGSLRLELLSSEGKRAPFAGIGLDAGILNHYVETKRAARGPMRRLLVGGGGYAAAIGLRSIPAYAGRARPTIEVRNRGLAYRMGSDGRPVGSPLGPGSVLYRGPALLAAASTVPCYGFNFKLFPFAGTRRGMMHLRIVDVSIPSILKNLYPSIWSGRWFPEGLHDFLCDDVELRSDHKVPFQVGGDAEGYRDYARFSMWKESVELIDFTTSLKI